jgi:hypothetical protein
VNLLSTEFQKMCTRMKKGLTTSRRKSFRSKYRRWDLNPHEVYPHGILNPARLPIPPLRRGSQPDTAVQIARGV